MANQEIMNFLENVLRSSYAHKANNLKTYEIYVNYLKTPGGKISTRSFLRRNWDDISWRMEGKIESCEDLEGYIKFVEQEVMDKRSEMKRIKGECSKFIKDNGSILNYISLLAYGLTPNYIPEEEKVFATFTRLTDNMPDPFYFSSIVKEAAFKHAKSIGKKPKSYYKKIINNKN